MTQIIEVVVGGQYGSEAKGHITAQLLKAAIDGSGGMQDPTIINVRVAGPNAGHTVYDDKGQKFALRQVPVGAALSDDIVCYIAPGSEVELEVLAAEVTLLRKHGHRPTLMMSTQATLLEDRHKRQEGEAKLVENIGSTGKGIGAARADRIMRKARLVSDDPDVVKFLDSLGVGFIEPSALYDDDNMAAIMQQHIIIEGTQGYGLGLHAGHYPQVTSSDCRALDFLAMAGLNPFRRNVMKFVVWVVARAYPIRVAGSSGPLSGETTWEALGLPEERTTVTQKVRRVGAWDTELVRAAVQANGGESCVKIALTMADQIIPTIRDFAGMPKDLVSYSADAIHDVTEWIRFVQTEVGAPVGIVTTSPTTAFWVN